MLNFDGGDRPYVEYTHVRCCSLLAKAGRAPDRAKMDLEALSGEEAQAVLRCLDRVPEVVASACQRNEPSMITRHIVLALPRPSTSSTMSSASWRGICPPRTPAWPWWTRCARCSRPAEPAGHRGRGADEPAEEAYAMDGSARRDALSGLTQAEGPSPAQAGGQFGVSRQVVVQDIAVLRQRTNICHPPRAI